MATLEPIGRVVRFYARAHAASIRLTAPLRVGDHIYLRGYTTDLQQRVTSLQISHSAVDAAEAGYLVGVQVVERCRPGDEVFRIG
jgi:hypothetical protein